MAAGLAGAALLLAFLFHQGVAAIASGILVTVPALYLAWKAIPAPARTIACGRRVPEWGAAELGVHRVVGGGPMPSYIRRPHDELLAAVLDPAIKDSRLVVLRGGSSTGKSRAAYEAVRGRMAEWRLDYLQDPGTLTARLEAGIPGQTVVWLGELRQYADLSGGAAALSRLADLLNDKGYLIITTVWPDDWARYTSAARSGSGTADRTWAKQLLEPLDNISSADLARCVLARGVVIDVPPEFTGDDLELERLGDAAHGFGLYWYAAALWTKAAALGSPDSAGGLVLLLHKVSPEDSANAARWAAARMSLDLGSVLGRPCSGCCRG
jgi:hypothetical protein